jgi:hypothetical protein
VQTIDAPRSDPPRGGYLLGSVLAARAGPGGTLRKFNLVYCTDRLKIAVSGGGPMSDLKDPEIERLSQLFASGSMTHAREIARLLKQEGQAPRPRPYPLLAALGQFLKVSRPGVPITPEA